MSYQNSYMGMFPQGGNGNFGFNGGMGGGGGYGGGGGGNHGGGRGRGRLGEFVCSMETQSALDFSRSF